MKPLQTLIIALLIAAMAVGALTGAAGAVQPTPAGTAVISPVVALDDLLRSEPVNGPVLGSVEGLTAMLAESAGDAEQQSHVTQEAPFIAALHQVLSAR